jgi:hypothetical protein
MGEEVFSALWAQGQVMDIDRAIAYALEESQS